MTFLENVDKAKLQKILLITISALAIIALTLLLVIIVMSINPNGLADSKLDYTDYTVEAKDLGSGSLILADTEHPFLAADEAWLNLVKCVEYRDAQPDATGVDATEEEYNKKNYIPWKNMYLNEEAMAATHRMLTDAKNSVKANPVTIDAAYGLIAFGDANNYENKTACLILLSDFTSGTNERVPLSEAYRNWFDKHAADYGFIKTANEDEYRYVGVAHAVYMSENKMSLKEYIEYLKKETDPSTVHKIKTGGVEYIVYYVECTEGQVIKVPTSEKYTISGTNEGGVIITVTVK